MLCVYAYVCMYVCIYIHMCICIYIYISTYIYIYIYIEREGCITHVTLITHIDDTYDTCMQLIRSPADSEGTRSRSADAFSPQDKLRCASNKFLAKLDGHSLHTSL